MSRSVINLPGGGQLGPYSDAVRAGDLVFLSGRIGLLENGSLADGIAGQTFQCIRNAGAVLEAGGMSLADVIKCTVYLASMANFEAMNSVYASAFAAPRPARTTIGVDALPLDAMIEIEMIARRPGADTSI